MGSGVQNWEVPEAEVGDWEAEQEAGEEEGGSWGGCQPWQEQEEKAGGCKQSFLAKHDLLWGFQQQWVFLRKLSQEDMLYLISTELMLKYIWNHPDVIFEQDEEKLKNTNKDLTMVKMKSMFAIGE